ncbi:MAG TPA: hypothetical protein VMJ10_07275 [Kofleriaceae bacterium]|nr:hypothetical protein [Kofleriaceae bacterium]
MKKCTSCSKDLPDAALHCVFCGAKQPPAPAVQPGMAKTAFGYSANEVMDQLGRPQQQPYPPPQQPPPQQPYQPPQQQLGALAPAAHAQAATMFAPGPGQPPMPQQPPMQQYQQPPMQQYQQPMQYAPPPTGAGPMSGGMGINAPNQHTPLPIAPLPSNAPYLGGHAARAGVPIEPWKDSLRMMLFIWGGVLLVAFATPTGTDPLAFHWSGIGDQPTSMLINTLLVAAIGLFGIVCAAIPMMPLPRGIMAALLGLAGIVVPMVIGSFPAWRGLLPIVGVLALVPGLLVRHEYTESMLARLLVTIGVLCVLAPLLIPAGGEIGLVSLFKELINDPGKMKILPILELALIVIVVMSLLAWMPGPASGGAKVFAWLLILWPAFATLVLLLIGGDIGAALKKSPFDALMVWVPPATYAVFTGYGIATVVGKQLE